MERERLTSRIKLAAKEIRKVTKKSDLVRELDGFEYDKVKAKILKEVLHNMNVSLGTLMSAMKQLSTLRGSDITPDGKIGGRGFVMLFKDVKQGVNDCVGTLSDITDSIADELKNPKWGLKDSELKQVEDVRDKVNEIEEVVEDLAEKEPSKNETEVPEELETEITETKEEESPEEETINSGDVLNSGDFGRYRDLVSGNVKDKVASVLSKPIMSNLILKGKNRK